MAYYNPTATNMHVASSYYTPVTSSFLLRFGQREVSVCRDFRKRFYPTNPFIECRAGVNPGHVEILLLRSWLIVFSKARL